jgi:hypothetical protein
VHGVARVCLQHFKKMVKVKKFVLQQFKNQEFYADFQSVERAAKSYQ